MPERGLCDGPLSSGVCNMVKQPRRNLDKNLLNLAIILCQYVYKRFRTVRLELFFRRLKNVLRSPVTIVTAVLLSVTDFMAFYSGTPTRSRCQGTLGLGSRVRQCRPMPAKTIASARPSRSGVEGSSEPKLQQGRPLLFLVRPRMSARTRTDAAAYGPLFKITHSARSPMPVSVISEREGTAFLARVSRTCVAQITGT